MSAVVPKSHISYKIINGPYSQITSPNEFDHRNLERVITEQLRDVPWIITYDDCELIRNIYEDYRIREYDILHNAGGSVLGRELIITNIPDGSFVW